jgi:hypothetical protein
MVCIYVQPVEHTADSTSRKGGLVVPAVEFGRPTGAKLSRLFVATGQVVKLTLPEEHGEHHA